jgi:D-amino peptidase
MNIYISCDMEGVDGIVTEKQSSPTGPFYEFAREQITGEVNAAAQGAFDAGADSVLVNDSHWDMTNLLPEKLDPRMEYITGSQKPLSMMQGVDTGFDGVFFIGYHARAGTWNSTIVHTFSGCVSHFKINGKVYGETGLNAMIAGYFGVPVIMISGDQHVAEEAREYLPWIRTATVKQGQSAYSARHLSVVNARELIRKTAAEAVRIIPDACPYLPSAPYHLEVQYLQAGQADRASMMPGSMRLDGTTLAFDTDDYLQAWFAFYTMTALASQAPMV